MALVIVHFMMHALVGVVALFWLWPNLADRAMVPAGICLSMIAAVAMEPWLILRFDDAMRVGNRGRAFAFLVIPFALTLLLLVAGVWG